MPFHIPVVGLLDPRRIYQALQDLGAGRSNAHAEISLTISVTTTTITDSRVGPESAITLTAQTANAAAEVGNGTIYVSSTLAGSFVLTHANNAQADRTFRYAIVG